MTAEELDERINILLDENEEDYKNFCGLTEDET